MSQRPRQANKPGGSVNYGKKRGKGVGIPPKQSHNDPNVIDKYKAKMLEEIEKRKHADVGEAEQEEDEADV